MKGAKAMGNKLTSKNVKEINLLEPLAFVEVQDPEGSNIVTDKKHSEEDKEGQITLEL